MFHSVLGPARTTLIRQVLVIGIFVLGVTQFPCVWADVTDEGRVVRVTGKLTNVTPASVSVDVGDGKVMDLAVSPRTRGEILSSAAKDVLVEGAAAVVTGDVDPDGTVSNADIIVHLADIPPSVSVFAPDQGKIAFAGIVVKADPLVLRATDRVKVQYVINSNGQRTPPQHWAGKDFPIRSIAETQGSYGGLHVNLGTQVQHLRPGAYVSAQVSKEAGQGVTYLFIRQDDELNAKDLGLGAKDFAKKKKAKKAEK